MKGEFCHANMARQDRARDRTSSDTINRNTVESLIMFFFFLFKCHLIEVLQQLLEPNLWEVSLSLVLPIRLWYGLRDGCRHFFRVFTLLVRDSLFPCFVPSALYRLIAKRISGSSSRSRKNSS